MTSRTIARRRALATTARESTTTGGGTPASETPGSRLRRTGFSIAKCSTFGGGVLFQIIVGEGVGSRGWGGGVRPCFAPTRHTQLPTPSFYRILIVCAM